MPQYEYVCDADGTRITLLRPMRDAEAPVEDPEGKGRDFRLVQSTFMTNAGNDSSPAGSPGGHSAGGMCGCGRRHGSCGGG